LEGAAAHHIHQYLHLAGAVGASPVAIPPQLFVPENEVHAALQRFNVPPSPDRPLFALNAGAEYGPAKRWPMDRFVAAAREISSRTSCRWLVLGGKADQPLTEELCRQLSANPSGTQCQKPLEPITINLAGRTTLRELCAVLKGARLLVTNDTGPMHVAAALGIPVIVPFGSTSPVLTGPGLPGDSRHQLLQSTVPCAPCFLRECPIDFRCMHSIQVEQVIEAVMRTWQAP
jgi:heptosyltransferase-2